ncbi:hypothetical protein C8J56DRAFT_1046744 [Mycena floridula]|nr:hypothetical protein C8J56DRAFT_1046744 [Mycena floridula]
MSEAAQPRPLADFHIFLLKEFLVQIAVQFSLYGMYSALVMIVIYKLRTDKAPLTAHHLLNAAAISMFLASTTQILINLAFYLIQLPTLRFDPPNIERALIYLHIFSNIGIRCNCLIGDFIMVWRTWVLWTNHSWIHILLCICLIGSFVGASVDFAFTILYDLSEFSDTPRFPPTGPQTLILTLPLCLTNMISTLLIVWKVWEYKIKIKQNLGLPQNRRTQVEQILILLTESGVVYSLLWVFILVFGVRSQYNQSFSYLIIIAALPQLVAIYPIIIIPLVTLEKANLESTVNGPSFSQSLQFASRPQAPTGTQSDGVPPDSTNSHIASVMTDSVIDDTPDSSFPEHKIQTNGTTES